MQDPTVNVKPRTHLHVDALLLRREAAARVLGVSARTLDKWVKRGRVKRLDVEGVGLFAVADLSDFVAQLRNGAAAHYEARDATA